MKTDVSVTEPRDYGHLLECKLEDLMKINDRNPGKKPRKSSQKGTC